VQRGVPFRLLNYKLICIPFHTLSKYLAHLINLLTPQQACSVNEIITQAIIMLASPSSYNVFVGPDILSTLHYGG
jgi:hypothetical protein